MRVSLFDTVDLDAMAAAAATRGGPAALIVACLVDGGVATRDPADPTWEDRDRFVTTDPALAQDAERQDAQARAAEAPAAAQPAIDWLVAEGAWSIAMAYGGAAVSRSQGDVFRVWCVLAAQDCDDGAAWEVARAAASSGTTSLVVVCTAPPDEAVPMVRMWEACGWHVVEAQADDPISVVGALDQALAAVGRPVCLVVTVVPAAADGSQDAVSAGSAVSA